MKFTRDIYVDLDAAEVATILEDYVRERASDALSPDCEVTLDGAELRSSFETLRLSFGPKAPRQKEPTRR